jgi:VanZ family protein
MKLDVFFLSLYCGFIFLLSNQSTLPLPMAFPHQDKLVHGSAYAVMAWFAWRSFSHAQKPILWVGIASVIFCSFYGITDEFHQSFVPGRDADVWDWLADTLGSFIMASILYRARYMPSKLLK